MIFPKDVILEDERVMLRPLKTSDIEFLLPFALHEPEIWIFSMSSPAGNQGMEKYIETTIQQRDAKNEYPFIIFDKLNNQYAGSSRFYDIQLANQTTQLGYTWYGKAFQRTGLNRHCKLLMLGFAFETWGMERVEFRADATNQRSIEAMKAIGCVEEGIIRSHGPSVRGGRRDSIVLSILKKEWLNGTKEKLLQTIKP
ncbi:MAG: GNAT family N-acetyltransferase [Chitinophagales bacterium]